MLDALLGAALRSLGLAVLVWLILKLPRLRNPHVQLTAWTVVLAASLLMPATAKIATILESATPISLSVLNDVAPILDEARRSEAARIQAAFSSLVEPEPATPAQSDAPPSGRPALAGEAGPSRDDRLGRFSGGLPWSAIASLVYALVAGAFLARIGAGLLLTFRLVRAATPLSEAWTLGHDVRISVDVSAPATFGSVILLPEDYADWPETTRSAVLAHEAAHARRGDFYVQIAAALNRAIFWFSPLSWWLQCRLSQLAEAVSDDAAIADVKDRPGYAEILLALSGGGQVGFGAVAMARPATVRARIERILAETVAPAAIGWPARAMFIASILPLIAIAGSPLAARPSNSTGDEKSSFEPALDEKFSDRLTRGQDITPTLQLRARTLIPPWQKSADVSPSTLGAATDIDSARPTVIAIGPERDTAAPVREAPPARQVDSKSETQLGKMTSEPIRSTIAEALPAVRADRGGDVARRDDQRKRVVESGGDRLGDAGEAVHLPLGRIVASAPLPRQSYRESSVKRDAARISGQVAHKVDKLSDSKVDSLSADALAVPSQETSDAGTDLCESWPRDFIGDPNGPEYGPGGTVRRRLVCRTRQARRTLFPVPAEAAERQSTIDQAPSAAQRASAMPSLCHERGPVAGDPTGQHAFYVCHENASPKAEASLDRPIEWRSTYFHEASPAETTSGSPVICFDKRWTLGDPSGQHAFYLCKYARS